MGANGLLAVFAILIAWYTLLTNERRIDLKLRLSKLNIVFIIFFISTILVIIYSKVLLSIFPLKPIPWVLGFNEDTLSFTCLCIIIAFFGFKILGKRIPKANLTNWIRVSEKYMREKKTEQLGYLFDKYHEQLFDIISNKKWYVRVHDFLNPSLSSMIIDKEKAKKIRFKKSRRLISKLFPCEDKNQEAIQLNISKLLKSKPFAHYLIDTYPHIAMKATCLWFRDKDEYYTNFFTYLISNPNSIMYRELRDNQSRLHTGEYALDESNAFLNFYLNDIRTAINLGIWKPVGDYVVSYIKKQKGNSNFYNQADNYFSSSNERWECPIFVGLVFFDVMISTAIFKRSKDHMWLMYYRYFLEGIIESYEISESIDVNREFPTRFDYLIYELIYNCNIWAGATEYLCYNDWTMEEIKQSPEYHASITLGAMMRLIITSDKFQKNQKTYLLEIIIKRMNSLDQNKKSFYSEAIFINLTRSCSWSRVDTNAVSELRQLYKSVDHVLKIKNSTFEVELSKIP
ncbi:hypothetical protein Q4R90_15095 [Morganella morganii]|uniref:hypothetical protein n=1 Tax=Morganella morganii TaxID=582 RepID=UPI000F5AA797|nr:hypothetical protein [Morganella morganii]MBT0357297.1 hypothetical protein [Morganella morganii subsp. morganii]WHZ55022.1 hypothetical protein QLX58_07055 [Morganella morganii]HBU8230321.1 hypothetical protein [Morganella morganii]HCR3437560.1 hypothetical protein [Morganella morganii]